MGEPPVIRSFSCWDFGLVVSGGVHGRAAHDTLLGLGIMGLCLSACSF